MLFRRLRRRPRCFVRWLVCHYSGVVNNADVAHQVRREIVSLHEFFVGWFSGTLAADDETFAQRFSARMDPSCLLIQPGGVGSMLSDFSAAIRSAHGSNPDFRITIRRVAVPRDLGSHIVATYEEWQRNAIFSQPPDNGRISTALLARDQSAPLGLRWQHVHETWLPAEIMTAGPFDF